MRRRIDPQPPHPTTAITKKAGSRAPEVIPLLGATSTLEKSHPASLLPAGFCSFSSGPSSHLLPTAASDGPSSHPFGFIFVLVLNPARACVTPSVQGALQTPGSLRRGWTCLHPDRGREPFGLENRVSFPRTLRVSQRLAMRPALRKHPSTVPAVTSQTKAVKSTPQHHGQDFTHPVTSLKEPRNGGNRTSTEPIAPSQSPYGGPEGERVS